LQNIITPLIDLIIILAGFLIITPIWSEFQFGVRDAYPQNIFMWGLLSYLTIWIISLVFLGRLRQTCQIKKCL